MSAYMVKDETINVVVNSIRLSYDAKSLSSPLDGSILDLFANADAWEKLGKALFLLNINSIENKDGIGGALEFRELDYKYHLINENIEIDRIRKEVGSLLNQCGYGDCIKKRLFLDLNRWQKINGWGSIFSEEYDPDGNEKEYLSSAISKDFSRWYELRNFPEVRYATLLVFANCNFPNINREIIEIAWKKWLRIGFPQSIELN